MNKNKKIKKELIDVSFKTATSKEYMYGFHNGYISALYEQKKQNKKSK